MRIVSLLPSATEIIWALGLEDQLVGVTPLPVVGVAVKPRRTGKVEASASFQPARNVKLLGQRGPGGE